MLGNYSRFAFLTSNRLFFLADRVSLLETMLHHRLHLVHVDCSAMEHLLESLTTTAVPVATTLPPKKKESRTSSSSSTMSNDDDNDDSPNHGRLTRFSTSTTTTEPSVGTKTATSSLEEKLTMFCAAAWHQQQLAYRVFDYLDPDGKGVVVVEDLQRAAPEFLWAGDTVGEVRNQKKKQKGYHGGNNEDDDDDVLVEMIQLADSSGEGLLSREDFVRIARRINLHDDL